MSASNAQPRESSARQSLLRAQLLLEEALELIDEKGETPDIGARLEEVIEKIKASLT